MFSRRTMTGPSTGSFQMPVCTVLPCQATSRGSPTFTDSKTGTLCAFPARSAIALPVVQVYSDLFRAGRDHAGDPDDLRPRKPAGLVVCAIWKVKGAFNAE